MNKTQLQFSLGHGSRQVEAETVVEADLDPAYGRKFLKLNGDGKMEVN
jgi:hypothetical protein